MEICDFPIWSGTWYTTDAIPESAKPGKKVLKTKSGHKIVLDDDGNSLTITDSNGNTVTMDQDTVTVTAGKATKIVVNAPKIELAGSSHPVALGDQVIAIPDATGAGVQRSYAPRRIGGGNVSGKPDGARTFTGPSAFRNFLEEGNLGMIAARKDEIVNYGRTEPDRSGHRNFDCPAPGVARCEGHTVHRQSRRTCSLSCWPSRGAFSVI